MSMSDIGRKKKIKMDKTVVDRLMSFERDIKAILIDLLDEEMRADCYADQGKTAEVQIIRALRGYRSALSENKDLRRIIEAQKQKDQ